MHTALLALILTISVQDQLDGTEIGDANQYVAFQSGGKYVAEREDKKAGKTTAHGTWSVDGNKLTVKVTSCKGPACKELGTGYSSDIDLVADRAITVNTTPNQGPLTSGSYYCHYQGCEKRTGVEIVTHASRPVVMKYLVDFLIDKNRTRDVTVVWWGKKIDEKVPASHVTYCEREGDKGKKGADQVAKDLSELPWLGKLEPKPETNKSCLFDVRVFVGDDVTIPSKR